MNDENWVRPETPVYVLCNPPETNANIKGLLWGNGDPDLARLQSDDYWAISKTHCYRRIEEEGRHCVEFKDYEAVFEGGRAEAISMLINLGADRARISVEVHIKDDSSFVRTGDGGTSVAGDRGIARAGRRGYAAAGKQAVAWAEHVGYAEVEDGGVAITDNFGGGSAIAGDGGVAIGQGGFNKLFAGKGGIAVAQIAGKIWVGDHGIGVCRRSGTVYGGGASVVVGETVSGDMASLLVARRRVDTGGGEHEWQVAYGFVGQAGIFPGRLYTVEDNRLIEKASEQDQK
jgi:hypothetical protein